MADAVLCAGSTVAGCLVAPVNRLCGYVISYDSHVRELDHEVAKLSRERLKVQDSINDARNSGKLIKAYVSEWVDKVEKGDKEARHVLDYNKTAKKTCFYGWLPNPKVRYCLGREARRKAEDIQKLIDLSPPGQVYDDPPPGRVDVDELPVISLASDQVDTDFDSRASILEDIMNALDDEKHKVIGIYGEGGVGKTTLLEQIKKKLSNEKRLFHMIVKANVSQNLDFKKIQEDIAYALGLKNLKDVTSEEGRKELLFKKLQNDPSEKVLIILDDLWKDLDLREVGIPSGDESKGCKLLLTSRFKNVLEQMKCDTPIFHLEGLKNDEAFRLFEKMVGHRLKDNEQLKTIADQVVKKLAGLPLLIISVASFLKEKDECAWRNAQIEIDESNKEKKETIVKLSYNHLKSEDAKTLFLLCGLIGGTIQVETLLVLGMGLGLFQRYNKTMPDLRDRLNNMLDELRSNCLLLEGGNDKDNVTIHDLYSEVVVSTPFQDQNSLMMNNNYGASSKKELKKCWAICLDDDDTDRLAELMSCQFPSLKILMLSMPKAWDSMEESMDYSGISHISCFVDKSSKLPDFKDMKELRVLCLHFMHITNLPPSIEILKNLRSLYIYNCNVEDVAIIGKLKALQSLTFTKSTISRLPKEMGELTNLRLLNLNDCKLQTIEPTVLERLIKLEELYMKESFDRWMGKNEKPSKWDNVALAELRNMTKLNSLEILICNPILLLEVDDLPFENLTRFCIDIGRSNKDLTIFWLSVEASDIRKFKGLRTMTIKLEGHDGILSKKWAQKALQKTQCLCLDGLEEFENAHELCIRGFPQLKDLMITNSSSIKYIASSSRSAFTILESLYLINLINLEKIYHRHITAECFSKLKTMMVSGCHRLKYLWYLTQMQNLVQLEKIEVYTCDSMRAIVRKDVVSTNYRVELPYLRCLELNALPNMTSFCTGAEITSEGALIQAGVVNGGGDEGTESVTTTSDLQNTYSDFLFDGKVSLPNLEDLWLHSVGSLKMIWHDELSKSSFCKLATITVLNCVDLLHIFPSTIIGRLRKLKSVEVENCPFLKTLFDCGPLDSNTGQTTALLPELVSIKVKRCPSLESLFNCGSLDSNAEHKIILLSKLEEVRVSGAKKLRHVVMSHSQIVLGFPNLETVSVKNCSDLRYLFPKYTATTLMKLKWLRISKCKQMKEVILEKEAGQSEAEAMCFPCLSTLTLEELDNLISFGSGSCSYSFSSLKDLKIVGCRNFGAFIPSPTNVKRQLGEMAEENDESPQPLFNEMVTFPNVRIEIEGIPCKELWKNHVPTDSIGCSHLFLLESVEVKNCPFLKTLFNCGPLDSNTEQTMALLPELVSIEVERCPSLESLFNCGSLDSNAEHKIILLSKLEKVRVSGAKKLRHVVMSHSQIVLGFPNLETVSVENCSELRYLFPKYMAPTLMKLMWLRISKCEQMKEVILEKEAGRSEAEVMCFPCLSTLTLEELDNLSSFGSGSCSYYFSSLEDLRIVRCCKFGTFIPSPTSVKRKLGETAEENDESPQPLFNEMVTFPNIRIEIEGIACTKLWRNHVPTDSAVCSHRFLLESVKVKNCQTLKSLFDCGPLDSNTKQTMVLLPKLVNINIENCSSLESLFNCGSVDSNAEHKIVLLPKLEEVRVSGAKKLRHVVMSHSQIGLGFLNLKTVSVENCSDLRYLFPNYTATTLVKLERLKITECEQMKEVILEKEVGRLETEVMSFPCLSTLTLKKLDNLISFGSGSCSYYFSSLQYLRIVGCCKFEAFIRSHTSVKRQLGETVEENNESPQPLFNEMVTFPNIRIEIEGIACTKLWRNHVPTDSAVCSHRFLLESVKVKNCPFLKTLFDCGPLNSNTEQTMALLPKLVSIKVKRCPSLVSMFNCGSFDSNAEHKIISLPKLDEVRVSGAKKLRHVVMNHSRIVLGFPNLEIMSVENCSDLRYLFPKYTATTLMKLRWLRISKCEQMKEVILEKEAGRSEAEAMYFPCLSTLTLEELDNLISFGSGSCSYSFSSLKDLKIVGCRNFGAFIPSPTNVKRQLSEMAEENDESLQPLFNEMVTFPNVRIEIEGIPCKELWKNHVPTDSIGCSHRFLLESVEVKNCPFLKTLFNCGPLDSNTEQTMALLPELVSIEVERCPSLESLYNCGSLDSNAEHKIILLSKLEKVRVSGAKKLRHVVMSHSQIVLGFPNLETVSVENCSELRYLFPKYMAPTLMKLMWLRISKCEQMKEVILEKEAGRSEAEVMCFPCLSTLTLEELDNLISFGSGSCSYYFSSLEDLRIVRCCKFGTFIPSPTSVKRKLGETAEENDESPQLLFNEMVTFPNIRNLQIEGVPCKELWSNHIPADSFWKLEFLVLTNCDNLQRIAPPQMWKVLQRCLKNLEVISCHLIEIIYEGHGMDIEGGELRELLLCDLENMKHIWQSKDVPNIPFPNLIDVEAVRCPHLKVLFTTFTVKFLGQIKKLVVESCENMKLIAGQELVVELIAGYEKGKERSGTVTFSKLTVLSLLELPNFSGFLPANYPLEFIDSEDYFPSLTYYRIKSCEAWDQFCGDWEGYKKERESGEYIQYRDWFPLPEDD